MNGAAAALASFVTSLTGKILNLVLSKDGRYKITLSWGEFDPLFDGTPATAKGKQERMMALGFFHHKLDGVEGPITKRCWQHMKEQLEKEAGGILDDAALQAKVKEKLQAIVQKDDGSRQAETDPLKNARIVFPGSFCFTEDAQLGNPLTAHRFAAEKKAWNDNLGLGRIPLVVDVLDRATGKPAAGVKICFEFVPPYAPAADQNKYLNNISSATERTQAPRAYLQAKLVENAGTPYGFNCADASGGRTPADVHGTLIAKGSVHGFPHKVRTDGRPNTKSVVGVTDAKGKTGAVLRPSRTAGDAYKLRVYVLHDDAAKKPDADEDRTTGVLTVWRNLRLAKIVIKPQATSPFAGSPPAPAALTGALGTITTATMQAEYAKAFHDLVIDKDAAAPVTMDAAAYTAALADAKKNVSNPRNYDLDVLIKTTFDSPYMFWLEDDVTYNANRKAGKRALDLTKESTWRTDIRDIIKDLRLGFMKHFTLNALPGVTIIRNEIGDSYSYWANPNKPAGWTATTSGVAVSVRGCFLWYPNATYTAGMPYPLTINAMHEMGHVLYLRHHYTSAPSGGGFPTNHDGQDDCLMGYLNLNTNDHCGKCLLKLRGWDESKV
jgi:hypothetical protein